LLFRAFGAALRAVRAGAQKRRFLWKKAGEKQGNSLDFAGSIWYNPTT
jgi:hypothetical protein